MKIERDFSFVHPIAPGAKNGVWKVGVDAAARIHSTFAGPIMMRHTSRRSRSTICWANAEATVNRLQQQM